MNYNALVVEYLQDNTKAKLAKLTGYTAKTIRKIARGEVLVEDLKEGKKAIKLIKEVGGFGSYVEAYSNAPKSIRVKTAPTDVVNSVSFENLNMARKGGQEIEDYLDGNGLRLTVFLLACSEIGTTQEEIKNICGSMGESECNNLIDSGYLKITKNRIETTFPNNQVCFSRKFIANNAKYMWQHYRSEHAGKKFNYIGQSSGKISREAIEKLHTLTQRYHEEVTAIFMHKDYIGDIPYYISFSQDSFGGVYTD